MKVHYIDLDEFYWTTDDSEPWDGRESEQYDDNPNIVYGDE